MPKARFNFPLRGLYTSQSVSNQPELTSIDMDNVRPFDVLETRARGGQRPGLDKWANGDQIGGGASPVVAMIVVHLANPLPDPTPGAE